MGIRCIQGIINGEDLDEAKESYVEKGLKDERKMVEKRWQYKSKNRERERNCEIRDGHETKAVLVQGVVHTHTEFSG